MLFHPLLFHTHLYVLCFPPSFHIICIVFHFLLSSFVLSYIRSHISISLSLSSSFFFFFLKYPGISSVNITSYTRLYLDSSTFFLLFCFFSYLFFPLTFLLFLLPPLSFSLSLLCSSLSPPLLLISLLSLFSFLFPFALLLSCTSPI